MTLPNLAGRTIIVGVTGGIACFKAAALVSKISQSGANVVVCMTPAATRFVTPLTFQALSGNPVYTSPWEHVESSDPQHVATARKADLMLIAPCTMDTLAKLAHGRADDVVSLVASAVDLKKQTILLAPAMNETMWNQSSTQRNVQQLRVDGFQFVGPDTGWQACRTSGVGRMAEPEEILSVVANLLTIDE